MCIPQIYKDFAQPIFRLRFYRTLSEKRVLSRTLKGSSAQPSAGTFKGSR